MRAYEGVLFALVLASCTPRDEKKTTDAAPAAASASSSTSAFATDAEPPDAAPADAASPDATPDSLAPALTSADGAVLPQTRDAPSTQSAAFQARLDLVWRAIVTDDPELAEPAFFPVVAYERVKAVAKPAVDWKGRLWKAYARDVHAYHKRLGPDPAAATFVKLDVQEKGVRWMEPGTEGNKLGYYRVLGSKLHYRTASGKDGVFEVKSLISWRGEWFVVHLAGFK